ncbi:hypothetical protein WJX81_003128 [Elliptochloris bilobata]|uniref:26S proteasome non-ATPase regulatory subunit 3 N-terminal TPR repeats domain-containing protein n=1 Tax=Elliptochloris bilobata TaxID=381761 RepID=A0AAW1Q9M0_9CHLO
MRSLLLALHRTAVLRHDEYGQETLLNLLLRNYLHYNLYDQAEKLRSKAQRPEMARSTRQLCRYLLYLGRIRAIQHVAETHGGTFAADKTGNLVARLRHNVIRAGLRRINLAYSRISLQDVAAKLAARSDCRQSCAPLASIASDSAGDNPAGQRAVQREAGQITVPPAGASSARPSAFAVEPANRRTRFCQGHVPPSSDMDEEFQSRPLLLSRLGP